jgi:hypothetical protein
MMRSVNVRLAGRTTIDFGMFLNDLSRAMTAPPPAEETAVCTPEPNVGMIAQTTARMARLAMTVSPLTSLDNPIRSDDPVFIRVEHARAGLRRERV